MRRFTVTTHATVERSYSVWAESAAAAAAAIGSADRTPLLVHESDVEEVTIGVAEDMPRIASRERGEARRGDAL
jgi:hypothetical protein